MSTVRTGKVVLKDSPLCCIHEKRHLFYFERPERPSPVRSSRDDEVNARRTSGDAGFGTDGSGRQDDELRLYAREMGGAIQRNMIS